MAVLRIFVIAEKTYFQMELTDIPQLIMRIRMYVYIYIYTHISGFTKSVSVIRN